MGKTNNKLLKENIINYAILSVGDRLSSALLSGSWATHSWLGMSIMWSKLLYHTILRSLCEETQHSQIYTPLHQFTSHTHRAVNLFPHFTSPYIPSQTYGLFTWGNGLQIHGTDLQSHKYELWNCRNGLPELWAKFTDWENTSVGEFKT